MVIFSSVVNKILTIFVRFCVQDLSNHFIFDGVIQEDKAGRASGDDYVLTNVVDIRTSLLYQAKLRPTTEKSYR